MLPVRAPIGMNFRARIQPPNNVIKAKWLSTGNIPPSRRARRPVLRDVEIVAKVLQHGPVVAITVQKAQAII